MLQFSWLEIIQRNPYFIWEHELYYVQCALTLEMFIFWDFGAAQDLSGNSWRPWNQNQTQWKTAAIGNDYQHERMFVINATVIRRNLVMSLHCSVLPLSAVSVSDSTNHVWRALSHLVHCSLGASFQGINSLKGKHWLR